MESKCGYGDDDGGKGDKEIKENPITARFRNEMKRDGCFFARQLLKLTIIVFFGQLSIRFLHRVGQKKREKVSLRLFLWNQFFLRLFPLKVASKINGGRLCISFFNLFDEERKGRLASFSFSICRFRDYGELELVNAALPSPAACVYFV